MHAAGLLLKALALAALVSSAAAQNQDQGKTTSPPATKDPVTQSPVTKDPVTQSPVTKDPVTQAPVTKDPVTTPPAPTTVAPIPTSMPPKNCSTLTNKDRVGFDLGNVRGQVTACPNECAHTPGCITWTWSDYNSGTCWLKSRAGPLIDKAGVTATECVNNVPSLVCNAFPSIDFVGMDIGSRAGKAPGDCCDICNTFTGCTAYAWNDFNGGTCWLKKSVGQTEYKPGVVSSSMLPLYGGVCAAEYNVDFVGNDIGNKPSKDAGVCCGQCKATTGCKAYTWSDYNGGTCWMKSGKGATAAKNGVTSATIAIY